MPRMVGAALVVAGFLLMAPTPSVAWGPCGQGYGYRGYDRGRGPGYGYRGSRGPVLRIRIVEPFFFQQPQRRVVLVQDPAVRQQVAAVQAALNARGYDAGPVDGVPGVRTRSAITRYQEARGWSPTGRIDDELLAALEGDAANDPVANQQIVVVPDPPPSTNNAAPSPGTKPSSSLSSNYPKGILVPDKPGYVNSPYAEHAGLVDVQGFSTGTMVRCPYTNKIFVVP